MSAVHCFTVNGVHIALDVESGAFHIVDETAFRVLTGAGGVDEAERAEAEAELNALKAAGLLFTEGSPAAPSDYGRRPVIKALCLHIAHACNLRCAYCFAGQGAYGGGEAVMPPETGVKAVDFLIKSSGGRQNLEMDFFGGEPTLGMETVKTAVDYARSRERETGKRFRFTFTTNGLLLDDDTLRFLNAHMDNVVLSIDGRPEVHDRMRKKPDGTGSYDEVLPKLLNAAAGRDFDNYYVRGTYTRYNRDFAADVLHLAEAGFNRISVEPVVAAFDAPYAIRGDDVDALCAEYEKLARIMAGRGRNGKPFMFFHFELDVTGGPCAVKRVNGCGAGVEYLAVTPDGALYPCHQFAGEDSFRMGDLDAGVINTALAERFKHSSVYDKAGCAGCWARYYCGGGCAANAFRVNGDILAPDKISCALQKKRVECALYLYAARRGGSETQ